MRETLWIKILLCAAVVVGGSLTVSAQKAEPLRIEFARGKSSVTKMGSLKINQEQEYVFGAKAGQTVTLKIVSTPKGKFTAFRLLGDGFDFASDYDSNYDLTFTAPETGDYLVFVSLNATDKVKAAKFALTLSIK